MVGVIIGALVGQLTAFAVKTMKIVKSAAPQGWFTQKMKSLRIHQPLQQQEADSIRTTND